MPRAACSSSNTVFEWYFVAPPFTSYGRKKLPSTILEHTKFMNLVHDFGNTVVLRKKFWFICEGHAILPQFLSVGSDVRLFSWQRLEYDPKRGAESGLSYCYLDTWRSSQGSRPPAHLLVVGLIPTLHTVNLYREVELSTSSFHFHRCAEQGP